MNTPQKVPQSIPCERITLVRPEPEDAQAVYEAVLESLGALRQFPASQPWALAAPSLEASLAFCRAAAESHEQGTDFPFLMWATCGGARGQLLGCCGLHRPNWAVPSFELGYWCRTSMTRSGFATEAVRGLIRTARDELGAQRLSAWVDSRNAASGRVAHKCGMVLERTVNHHWREPDGTLATAQVFGLATGLVGQSPEPTV